MPLNKEKKKLIYIFVVVIAFRKFRIEPFI